MNKLSIERRVQILTLLCEGNSMRSISRIADVSINTVSKLLVDAGEFCAHFHDTLVQNVQSQRVQVDETWTFTYAKQKQVPTAIAAPENAGDTWTWTALDADSKLIVSWLVGARDVDCAMMLMRDLRSRLANRVQLTTDGHRPYLVAVDRAFLGDVDYAMLVKIYGGTSEKETRYSPARFVNAVQLPVTGDPDPKHISTSYVERLNLTMRMHMRRFTRLTNAFSKKLENHAHMVAIYTVWYNWVRIHKTLRVTPAMAAGLTDRLWDMTEIVKLLEAKELAKRSN